MSQPQKPGSNLLTAILLATTVFLGLQLLNGGANRNEASSDKRSSAVILEAMRKMDAEGKDITIQAERRAYEAKLKEEAQASKMSEATIRQKVIESWVLAMHTSTKAGIEFNESGRLSTAFNSLDHERKAYLSDPVWTSVKVPVYGVTGMPQTAMSGEELYQTTVSKLGELNKHHMVWGFFPGYQAIDALVKLTGSQAWFSYTFAALLLALIVRAIVYPLAQKQLMFSRQMMQLQPLAAEIKKKLTNKQGQVDQQRFQLESMQLYREYGINPAAGCAPALAQMPLFLLVFQSMLLYRFEFSKGLFAWINPSTSAGSKHLFAANLGQTDYILLVVYGVSMVIATYLQPVTDPNNVKQQRMMGIGVSVMVTVMMFFYPLPSAFVLYWIFLNIFSTLQSLRAYRLPVPPLQKVATVAGGVRSKSGFFAKLMEEQQKAQEEMLREKVRANEKNGAKNGKAAVHTDDEDSEGEPKLYKPKNGKETKK